MIELETRPASTRAVSPRVERGTIILVTVGVMWLISATALAVYTAGTRDPVTHRLTIPPGTGEQIAAGQNPLDIPSTWSFYSGDTLVLINDDVVAHTIGGVFAPAGTTVGFVLKADQSNAVFCTLHPSGAVTLSIEPRGFDVGQTVVPTLALGLPLGIAAAFFPAIMRALSQPNPIEAIPNKEGRKPE